MTKQRLDIALTGRGLTSSRSQSESFIKLGKVTVDGRVINKSGYFVGPKADIKLLIDDQYVSRAGLKLASVADVLKLDFKDKIVLDVGSSTGGFTDFALRHGAKKVYAVDVGTDQLHPSLRGDKRIELHEKTDIRDFFPRLDLGMVLIDVSFISVRDILPHISELSDKNTQIVVMVKPQFETHKSNHSTHSTGSGFSTGSGLSAGSGFSTGSGFSAGSGVRNSHLNENVLNKGVIKNDSIRRQILRDFEEWSRKYFVIVAKRDSDVAGAKGNQERFYLLSAINRIK